MPLYLCVLFYCNGIVFCLIYFENIIINNKLVSLFVIAIPIRVSVVYTLECIVQNTVLILLCQKYYYCECTALTLYFP